MKRIKEYAINFGKNVVVMPIGAVILDFNVINSSSIQTQGSQWASASYPVLVAEIDDNQTAFENRTFWTATDGIVLDELQKDSIFLYIGSSIVNYGNALPVPYYLYEVIST